MELTPTTELEAVNEMLGAIGETPVSDLDIVGNTDCAIAVATLRAVAREVQTKGWWFNTDDAYEFTLDVNGHAILPAPLLSLRPVRGGLRLTQRMGRVYDLSNRTDVFAADNPPVADVVWFYDYETIPESARQYIYCRAGRIFESKVLGSDSLHVFTTEREREVEGIFFSEHDDFEFARGRNFLTGDPETNAIWNRGN